MNASSPPAWKVWTGRILSALPALAMLPSGAMKLSHSAKFLEGWTKFGYPESAATPIGIVELAVLALYLIPKTRVLGAILVTGYLGGAVATHARMSDPAFVTPVILGVIAWAGVYLRDERLQELLPLVKDDK
jgi:hypothetical protein